MYINTVKVVEYKKMDGGTEKMAQIAIRRYLILLYILCCLLLYIDDFQVRFIHQNIIKSII